MVVPRCCDPIIHADAHAQDRGHGHGVGGCGRRWLSRNGRSGIDLPSIGGRCDLINLMGWGRSSVRLPVGVCPFTQRWQAAGLALFSCCPCLGTPLLLLLLCALH